MAKYPLLNKEAETVRENFAHGLLGMAPPILMRQAKNIEEHLLCIYLHQF